jgi:hypothetical protein
MRSRVHIIFFASLLLFALSGCGGWSSEHHYSTDNGITQTGGTPAPETAQGASVTLQWHAPNADADGSTLTDLAGYKVYYGNSSKGYTQSMDLGNSTRVVIKGLSPGTWCFSVTAYDKSGNESGFSGEACKTV